MRRSYMVEILFNLLLFTLFVLCSFVIVVSGAKGYENIVSEAANRDENRIALSYLATKLRQAPSAEAVYTKTVDGIECLVIEEGYYQSVIYFNEGAVYELYSRFDADMALSDAEYILDVHDLIIDEEAGYFVFQATNEAAQTETLRVAVR